MDNNWKQVTAVRDAMNRCLSMTEKIEEAIDVHGPDLSALGRAINCSQDRALASMLAELCSKRVQPADRDYFMTALAMIWMYDESPPEGHA